MKISPELINLSDIDPPCSYDQLPSGISDEPVQECRNGDDSGTSRYPQRAKSSHKQNARKTIKRNRGK